MAAEASHYSLSIHSRVSAYAAPALFLIQSHGPDHYILFNTLASHYLLSTPFDLASSVSKTTTIRKPFWAPQRAQLRASPTRERAGATGCPMRRLLGSSRWPQARFTKALWLQNLRGFSTNTLVAAAAVATSQSILSRKTGTTASQAPEPALLIWVQKTFFARKSGFECKRKWI